MGLHLPSVLKSKRNRDADDRQGETPAWKPARRRPDEPALAPVFRDEKGHLHLLM